MRITVSTSWFVPKPHTAFQWEAQIPVEEYQRRVSLLRDALKRDKSITYNWHDPQTSYLEAVFSRGDRRLADVLEWAWQHGAKFDSWSEYFDYQRWMDALEACGLDGDFYAHRDADRAARCFPGAASTPLGDPRFPVAGAGAVLPVPDHPGLPNPLFRLRGQPSADGRGVRWLTACSSPRLGRAKYISHLDLMRTFQRAFFRAGIQIRHTEGFNPHPFVSIALPLSVGYSSQCEILEFGLVGGASYEEVPARLTAAMPEGIVIHQLLSGPAAGEGAVLGSTTSSTMEYEEGPAFGGRDRHAGACWRGRAWWCGRSPRRPRPAYTEVDLIPLIHSWNLEVQRDTMTLDAVLAAQNPGLNPELIRAAFCETYPDLPAGFRHLPPPCGAGRGGKGVPLTGV